MLLDFSEVNTPTECLASFSVNYMNIDMQVLLTSEYLMLKHLTNILDIYVKSYSFYSSNQSFVLK